MLKIAKFKYRGKIYTSLTELAAAMLAHTLEKSNVK